MFMPSRHALFARLNLILPEIIKKKLLFVLFPHKAQGHDGFKAYYNQCTPKEFRKLASRNDFEVIEVRPYYISSYFQVFAPLYVLWRLWIMAFKKLAGENAAETFSMVLKKKHN